MLCAFFFTLLIGCGLEMKTLSQLYEGDLNKVTKLVIFDGNTGYKKTVEDKQVIDDFLGEINDTKFIPEENQEQRDGFNYSITLFQDEEKTFQFGLTQVDGHYYHTEPDLFPVVDKFYKNLNSGAD